MSVRVHDAVGNLGGLDPDKALVLAKQVIALRSAAEQIELDFEHVGTVSSGFANALFLALAAHAPLESWRQTLVLKALDKQQGQVLARSLRAARNAIAHGQAAS